MEVAGGGFRGGGRRLWGWRKDVLEVVGNVSRGNWPELRMGVARGRVCVIKEGGGIKFVKLVMCSWFKTQETANLYSHLTLDKLNYSELPFPLQNRETTDPISVVYKG